MLVDYLLVRSGWSSIMTLLADSQYNLLAYLLIYLLGAEAFLKS